MVQRFAHPSLILVHLPRLPFHQAYSQFPIKNNASVLINVNNDCIRVGYIVKRSFKRYMSGVSLDIY